MVIDRVRFFIDYMSISVSAFERSVGLPNGYISKIKKNIGQDKLEEILRVYPQLRSPWLYYGEGEMLQSSGPQRDLSVHLIPMLPSFSLGMSIPEFLLTTEGEYEQVISPIEGVDFAIKMVCDSMTPEYPVGSTIIMNRVCADLFLEWGKVYLLDTPNGIMVRRVMPTDNCHEVRCESNNSNYPPINMSRNEIRGFYRVVLLMITK